MADGIDIGDIETRFNIDLSGLKAMTDKAAKMFEDLGDKGSKQMDVSKGVERLSDQVKKMNETITAGFSKMQETAKNGSAGLSDVVTKNTSKMRSGVGKNIEAMVRDINSKMEQAKAAQMKIQSLSMKRASAQSSGDASKALQFDAQIATAQASMDRYQNQAKALAQSMSREFDAVPESLKRIAASMDTNEGKINALQAKLKGLQASYKMQQVPVSGDFESGFTMGDSQESLKTKAQIDKLQASVAKLIVENDSLNASYASTEDRATQLKSALSGVNTELAEEAVKGRMAGSGLDSMNDKSNKGGGFFNRLRSGASGFFGLFNRSTNQSNAGMERMNRNLNGMRNQLGQVGAQVFLYGLLGQGLMSLVTWLWQAAETNSAFAASFNQVRVNLLTAFYPIYTAVMPALTALMQGLAKVTGVLASFIATLFGTTYSAAKKGASGLQQQVAALNETASSDSGVKKSASSAKKLADNTKDATKKAKELQQSLASFDEINTLTKQSDTGTDAGSTPDADTPSSSTPKTSSASPLTGADFGAATGNYSTPQWLKDLIADVKRIAKELWDPIKEAWDAVGQKVIDALKYALTEVWGLIKAIGKSFLEVWDNGTGKKFVENLLILLADVLNIIGDIAKAFKDAWNDGGRGTRLIQTIFDAFNAILELLHSIATSFRQAWNDGTGERIAANILDIFTNIARTIENIAKRMKVAWDDNGAGEKLFSTILGMVNDILDAINKATRATADWAGSLDFGPLLKSVDSLLAALRPFAKDIWDGLEWGYEHLLLPLAKFTIEKALPDFFDVLAAVLKVVTAVLNDMKPVVKWLFDSFLGPIAKWTGGSFHGIMQGIVDILTKLSNWISKHQKLVDAIVISLAALLALRVANGWLSSATGILGKIVDKAVILAGKEHVLRDFFKGITGIDKLEGAVTQLKSMWKVVSENWNGSKLGQWLQNGPLAGATQSLKGAGGFSKLTMAGKVATGAAGVGVALGAGWDIVSALKEKNPDKKFQEFGSGAGTAIGGGLGLFFGGPLGAAIGSQIGSVIGGWAGGAAKSFTDGWNAVGKGKKPDDWLGAMGWDAKQMSQKIGTWFGNVVDTTSKWLNTALDWIQKHWVEVTAFIVNPVLGVATWFLKDTKTGKNILKWASTLPGKAADWAKGVGKKISDHIDSGKKKVKDAGTRIGTWISNFKDGTSRTLSTWAGALGSKVHDGINGAKTLATRAGSTLGGWVTSFRSGSGKTLSTWAKGLGGLIGKGLGSGVNAVKNGAKKIANGIVGVIGGAVNGVIKGINWVLGKVGSSKRLGKWSVPSFATGGHHRGGPALVNDASGSIYQEAYRLPDGRTGLFPAMRNLMLNLPAGTQIMPANRVAQKMAAMVPHYAGGLFDFDFDFSALDHLDFSGLSNIFSGVGSTVSNVVGSVSDTISKFMDNPGGLWKWVVSKYAGLSGKSGLGVDIANGAIGKMASSVISMFKKGLADFAPEAPSGSGAGRWRSTVVKALQKNGLSTSSAMVNKVLRQIQTESGGNEKAVQGNIGDINNATGDLAKGLMQTISATFNAYKFPGHGNIFNGYDNLLAALNYAKARYGSNLSYLGQGHGYANGGLINRDGMYRVGENDLSEMVVPLTKPARAVELMQDALSYMGLSAADLVTPGIVNEPSITGGLSGNGVGTSSLTGMDAQTIGKIIAETIADILGDAGGQSDTDMPVTMQMDDDVFGQVIIKAINKRIQKLGYNPIKL